MDIQVRNEKLQSSEFKICRWESLNIFPLSISSRPKFSGHHAALAEGSGYGIGPPCTALVITMWKRRVFGKVITHPLWIYTWGWGSSDDPLNSNMEFKITNILSRWHLWQINCEYISLNNSHLKHFDNMRHYMEIHLRFVNTEHSTQYRLIKIHVLHKLCFS